MLQYQHEYKRPRDYELQGTMRKTHVESCAITVSADNDDSAVVDLRGYGLIGLIVPELDQGSNLEFYVSETEGGTYRQLTRINGMAVTILLPGGMSAVATDALSSLAAYRWVKIHTTEVQTLDRTFIWILKA